MNPCQARWTCHRASFFPRSLPMPELARKGTWKHLFRHKCLTFKAPNGKRTGSCRTSRGQSAQCALPKKLRLIRQQTPSPSVEFFKQPLPLPLLLLLDQRVNLGVIYLYAAQCAAAAAKLGLKSWQLLTLRLPAKGFARHPFSGPIWQGACEKVNKEINLLIYRSVRPSR